jgi:hypothetical protein
MADDPHQRQGESHQPDEEEKKVATVAVRLPVLILLAIVLMLAVGIWATMR